MHYILNTLALCCLLLVTSSAIAQEADNSKDSNTTAPIGTKENPVRCDDPDGERWYLTRLRDAAGNRIQASRMGSTGAAADGHIMDMYRIRGTDTVIFMDMYHPDYVESRPVPGFRLVHEFCDGFEYIDSKIHKFGEAEAFTGDMIQTDDDGAVVAKAKVNNGVIEGALTRFGENQRIVQTIEYSRELRHGKSKYYFESGKLWAESSFAKGQLSGTRLMYYENGQVNSRQQFVDGLAHGLYESFYENGKPKSRGTQKQGVWDGKYTEWDEQGQVTRELDLVDGRPRE